MDAKIESYVKEVICHITAHKALKDRIAKDLRSHISIAVKNENIDVVIARMGRPEEVAKEFMSTMYEEKNPEMEKLIHQQVQTQYFLNNYFYEYKSKKILFGLPLVHIKLRRGWGMGKPAVAKGIIALGDISIGVISMGAVSLGGLSLGAISLGLLALGGAAVGGVSLGGLAIGLLAVGGCAVGLGAIGGAAFGKIALGGYAKGVVAIGGKAIGEYIISGNAAGSSYSLETVGHLAPEQVSNLIKSAYPNISEWIIKIFTFFVP
ncbi:MAG: XRE family transcriptional regulator [Clostridia bacterium]|nr:XRE family transcriptional regulator [Clostridia bacterium]